MKPCQELRVCGLRGELSKSDETPRYGRKNRSPRCRAQTEMPDIRVLTGWRAMSTPNKMVGKARQNSTGRVLTGQRKTGKRHCTKRPHLFGIFYEHCAIGKFWKSRCIIKILRKEEISMKPTILSIENRISMLKGKDPVGNAAIIKKLERQLRRMKSQEI